MFTNTHKFSEAANNFIKDGVYTKAPINSYYFKQFWEEEINRCINGYKVNNVAITGRHYFYLNYCPINMVKENSPKGITAKSFTFPRFLDVDFEYYHIIERCFTEGKGLCVGKARRKGFSFKNSSIAYHSYLFTPNSNNVIAAYKSEYAQDTITKVFDYDTHLAQHSTRGLYLKHLNKSTTTGKEQLKAGERKLIDGVTVEVGTKSEISTVTFFNNPSASIGKSVNIILFEEAGKWDNLLDCWDLISPIFMDGYTMTGLPIVFGTGGDMEKGTIGFCDMFYDPDKYNFLAFDNKWDDDATGTKCGYFVPHYYMAFPYVDDDGNSDIETVKKIGLIEREEERKKGSPLKYDTKFSQHPFTPAEAFVMRIGNIFPKVLLDKRIQKIVSTKEDTGEKGRLEWTDYKNEKSIFVIDINAAEAPYPFKSDNKQGCVTIYYHPIESEIERYIASLDPVNKDDAESSDSLLSCIVYDRLTDTIVAEYTGRPDVTDDYYEELYRLICYYNCRLMHENMVKDVITFFRNKRALHRLHVEPEVLKGIHSNYNYTGNYGMPMNAYIKAAGETYILNWLLTDRGVDDKGNSLTNIDFIKSIHLLKELATYRRKTANKKRLNFDRVMSLMQIMFKIKEDFFQFNPDFVEEEEDSYFRPLDKYLGFVK